jgi:hypothetical protein
LLLDKQDVICVDAAAVWIDSVVVEHVVEPHKNVTGQDKLEMWVHNLVLIADNCQKDGLDDEPRLGPLVASEMVHELLDNLICCKHGVQHVKAILVNKALVDKFGHIGVATH